MRGSGLQGVLLGLAAPTALAAAGCFAAGYWLLGLVLAALSLGLVYAGWRAVKRGRTTEAMEAKTEYDRLHGREAHGEPI
ncbi:hypothetical protein GCM10009767_06890 [Kocuria aegyptia]|uniref:Uncharacterized protein n=1 Tax=Kocuria aegyptia TaxID=330943 RepID=A0ABP4WE66_9MICC